MLRVVIPALLGALLALSGMAAGAPVTLEMIHCWDGEREPLVNAMLREFEAEHPGVAVEPVVSACGNSIKEKVTVAIASGTLPDIVMVHSDQIPVIYTALAPLDARMERENITDDVWYPSEIAQGRWAGGTYAFPIRPGGDNNHLLFWNKRIFAESGLDPETPPRLWSEMLDVSRRVVRYNGDVLTRGAINLTVEPERRLSWLYTGDGALLDAEARRVLVNTPEARETLNFFRSFVEVIYLEPRHAASDGTIGGFAGGQVAMHAKGASTIPAIRTRNPELDFGIGVMPSKTPDSPSGVHAGTWLYAVSRGTQHPDESWALLKWLTLRYESAGRFMLDQGRPSPVRAVNQSPDFFELNPYWAVVGEAINRSAYLPIIPDIRVFIDGWEALFTRVVIDGAPIESELENLQATLQSRLDEYWARAAQ